MSWAIRDIIARWFTREEVDRPMPAEEVKEIRRRSDDVGAAYDRARAAYERARTPEQFEAAEQAIEAAAQQAREIMPDLNRVAGYDLEGRRAW